MFEIVKVLVETVIKAVNVDSLLARRKSQAVSTIGADLFALYSSLNEIYVTGTRLIDLIEQTIERIERYKTEGRTDISTNIYGFEDILEKQFLNIQWFANSFIALSAYIDVIDPESSRKLALFMQGKGHIIHLLHRQFSSPRVTPADASRSNLILSRNFEAGLIDFVEDARNIGPLRSPRDLTQILDVSGSDSVDTDRLAEEDVRVLRDYLSQRKPREHLDALSDILKGLHERLLANFDLKDVLIAVGERARLPEKNDWVSWHPRR